VAEPTCAAASLGALQPALTLFAQALAGRSVALREDAPAPRHAAVTATTPITPTIAITLPAQIAWFSSERDNRGAYRIAVMREALAGHDDESLQQALAAASVCASTRRSPAAIPARASTWHASVRTSWRNA
jgi:hypothetical protein